MTRFSIAVPIGAWHPLMKDCLESLICQDVPMEIAVLDASADSRTADLVDQYRDQICYVRTGPDGGQSDAIIEGWANTSGDVLGWLNADDALAPGALAKAARRLDAEPSLDAVYGHSLIINESEEITGYHWAVEPPSDKLLKDCIISQPSCFFRRLSYEAVGGLDQDLHYTMDWDLWIRMYRAGQTFGFIDDVLSRVLWAKDTKTGQFNKDRRRELNRLINQNSRLRDRVNSKIGFFVHHQLQKPAFKRLQSPANKLMAPAAYPINGISRDGEILSSARLPLFHYRKSMRRVQVKISGRPGTKVDARLEGGSDTTHTIAEDGSGRLNLDCSIPAGTISVLDIVADSADGAWFGSLNFED
ncbi:MAG: glycosyltransferase [Henriciella sp.]